jgi:hypothetical protein
VSNTHSEVLGRNISFLSARIVLYYVIIYLNIIIITINYILVRYVTNCVVHLRVIVKCVGVLVAQYVFLYGSKYIVLGDRLLL